MIKVERVEWEDGVQGVKIQGEYEEFVVHVTDDDIPKLIADLLRSYPRPITLANVWSADLRMHRSS
jgi:hypothetical protein